LPVVLIIWQFNSQVCPPLMTSVRFLLLFVWSVLALLGHSGTHALADWMGICCHVTPTATAVGADAGVRCACHRHATPHRSSASHGSDADSKQNSSDTHDPSNCRLCDWFLKFQPECFSPAAVSLVRCIDWVPVFRVPEAIPARVCDASSRGPPHLA
jgi:hypothetical protein